LRFRDAEGAAAKNAIPRRRRRRGEETQIRGAEGAAAGKSQLRGAEGATAKKCNFAAPKAPRRKYGNLAAPKAPRRKIATWRRRRRRGEKWQLGGAEGATAKNAI